MNSQNFDLVCFGELIWDMLPGGKVAGGAPFNIVNRANNLGTASTVIGSVGEDTLGTEFLEIVRSLGNSTDYIQTHPSLPTSVVLVTIGEEGEPQYDIVHPVAWDDIQINDEIIRLVSQSKAFVYSSLALRDERSRTALFKLLPYAGLKICDVNLREGHFTQDTIMRMIRHADILRMNESELEMICHWTGLSLHSREEQIKELTERYNYKMVIVTLGGEGAICFHQGNWYQQPVFKVDVKDTVGSGDAFLASFIYQYLKEAPIAYCLRYACAVGALTASKPGGTPIITHNEIDVLLQS